MRNIYTTPHSFNAANGISNRRCNSPATAQSRQSDHIGVRASGWSALRAHWILKEGKLLLVWTHEEECDYVPRGAGSSVMCRSYGFGQNMGSVLTGKTRQSGTKLDLAVDAALFLS